MFSKIAVFTHKNRAWGSGNADFLVLLVLAKLDPFWQYRGQRAENKFSKFSTKSRWTLYDLKIEALVKTSSNFLCILITCKRSLLQVCNLMSIHYDVIIAAFCSFFRTSGLLLFLGMFPHYFCTFFFKTESTEVFQNFVTSFVVMTS